MSRVVKDPEQRKNELLETAEKLFVKNGYDKTLVSDIVKEAGVAQGTFYYYFKSKDEALAALLERKWEQIAEYISKKFEEKNTNALGKLHMFFGLLFSQDRQNTQMAVDFRVIMDPGINDRFHGLFDEARVMKLKPVMCKIVKEGIEEKVFCGIKHQEEVVEILFYGINSYMHIYSKYFSDVSLYEQKISALEELMERVLGLPQGSLNFRS